MSGQKEKKEKQKQADPKNLLQRPEGAEKPRLTACRALVAGIAIIFLVAATALAGAASGRLPGFFTGAVLDGFSKPSALQTFFSHAYTGLWETVNSFSLLENSGLKRCLENVGVRINRPQGAAAGFKHLQKKMQEHDFYVQSASLIVWAQAVKPVTGESGAAGKDASPDKPESFLPSEMMLEKDSKSGEENSSLENASLARLVKKVEASWLDSSFPVWPQGIWSTGSWDGAVEVSYSRPLRPDLNFQAWERRFVFPGEISPPAEEFPDSAECLDVLGSAGEYPSLSPGEERSTVVLCLEWAIEDPVGQDPGIPLEQAEATLKEALIEEGWPAKTVFEVRGCCPRLLGEEEARRVADDILLSLGAKEIEYFVQPPLFSVTARVAGQEEAVLAGGKKVSLQMAMRPHPEEGSTYFYAGIPMLLAEY